jgi:flavin reductase (DIM6/NTAB) family NADH-FMN oxidoreductase RutF
MTDSIFTLTNPEIYVITAVHQGQRSGQVATWVTLAALDPEQIRVVAIISPRNFTFDLIRHSGRFAINLLAQGQEDWLTLFGLYSTREVDKFAGLDLQTTPTGIPLLPGTCGWAECQIVQAVDLGDRMVFIADVLHHQLYEQHQPLCRIEAMQALPSNIVEELAAKRLRDIECDCALRASQSPIKNL